MEKDSTLLNDYTNPPGASLKRGKDGPKRSSDRPQHIQHVGR